MCLAKGKFLTDAFYGNRNPGGKEVKFHVHRNTVQKEEWCRSPEACPGRTWRLEKRKGMGFAADVSRLSKGILNERLQVLISCVARWLVVHMY